MSGTDRLDVLEARTSPLRPRTARTGTSTPRPRTTVAPRRPRSRPVLVSVLVAVVVVLGGCGSGEQTTSGGGAGNAVAPAGDQVFTIGAIPDQDPEKLQRLYGTVADHLSEELGVTVDYEPVTDYAASVSLFRAGDLDMVWFGGLTGVQARLQVDGAEAILQRGIDERFHSVFIANTATGLQPIDDLAGLAQLEGRRFTFGSESSTSGRLMPEHFLRQAGVSPETDFAGPPGFSGSHDKTIELVAAGTFEAGVVNEQVWNSRRDAGEVDLGKVTAIFRTPPYHDYHWVIRPDLADRFGDDFVDRVKAAFTGLDRSDPTEAEILELFGADEFIETDNGNYAEIEEVARDLGLIAR